MEAAGFAPEAVVATERRSPAPVLILLATLGLFALADAAGASKKVAPLVLLVVPIVLAHRTIFRWRNLLAAIVLVVMFIPMRRYVMAGGVGFQLDPYRLLVGIVLLGWIVSLLVDSRVRVRRSGFELQMAVILGSVLCSDAANGPLIHDLGVGGEVAKKLIFFFTFVFIYYLSVSVLQSHEDVDLVLKVLVALGAIVALTAVAEFRSGFNTFDHLAKLLPFLQKLPYIPEAGRGGHVRAYASSEQPIAMSAVFVMLIPVSIYVALRTAQRRWWVAVAALILGAFATTSRTGVTMLIAVAFVFLRLRPRETKRSWRILIVVLLLSKVVAPGAIGTLRYEFFPDGKFNLAGLIAQQDKGSGGFRRGRVGRLSQAWPHISEQPVLGQGYGTRTVGRWGALDWNSTTVDDEWLKTLLETGLVGVVGWFWMFRAFGARAKRLARSDDGPLGWLAVSLWAAVAAYGVGMLTYDAFSFIQVTVILFLLLGLGAVTFRLAESNVDAPALAEEPGRPEPPKRPIPVPPAIALREVERDDPDDDGDEHVGRKRRRGLRLRPVDQSWAVTFILGSLLVSAWQAVRSRSVG